MVFNYLALLKEKTGMSWADIEAASRIPQATVRKIFSGETKNPAFDTVVAIVIAMGGNINDLIAGIDPNLSASEEKTESESFNFLNCKECHIVTSMVKTYESRIEDMKESFNERSTHFRNVTDSRIEDMKKDKMVLSITLGCLICFLIIMIIIDLCIGTKGWIRY